MATQATATPAGPYATADAFQTLKPRRRMYERIVLSVELGTRAVDHLVEVTR